MWGENQERPLSKVRDVTLLPGEGVVKLLSGRDGLVEGPQRQRPLLALTDRRLLLFSERDGQEETVMASLEHVQGAVLKTSGRSWRPLAQGLSLMVIALFAYLLIGNFIVEGVLIPAVVGIVIGFFGVYMVLRYIFWEEEGSITLQGEGWAFSFPYRVHRHDDVLAFLNSLFELKRKAQRVPAGEGAVTATPQGAYPSPQPPPPSPAGDEGASAPSREETGVPPSGASAASDDTTAASKTTPGLVPGSGSGRPLPDSGDAGEGRRDLADPGIGDDVQA